jgi:hypothetical protein
MCLSLPLLLMQSADPQRRPRKVQYLYSSHTLCLSICVIMEWSRGSVTRFNRIVALGFVEDANIKALMMPGTPHIHGPAERERESVCVCVCLVCFSEYLRLVYGELRLSRTLARSLFPPCVTHAGALGR